MKITIESSRLIKPLYQGTSPLTSSYFHLSVFDKIAYAGLVPLVCAYLPPTPPNITIELGLRKALAVYRELAGRLGRDDDGKPIILVNDEGVRFVEASVDADYNQTMISSPSFHVSLQPNLENAVELVQVQITRFSCGSMIVGFAIHHLVADGHAASNFLVAWSQASRGLEINSIPFHDHTIFSPRNPPRFEFEHKGVEFITKNTEKLCPRIDNNTKGIVQHKVHYTAQFLSKLKDKASTMNENKKLFTTFESLVAHLWRVMTKARALNESETTHIKIAVDGRSRLKPKVPKEYFGNLVLYAFVEVKVNDLLRQPLSCITKLLHEAIIKVNDDYFKSFIDFSNYKINEEKLIPNTISDTEPSLWPNLEVFSWLRFPFYDLDFGRGGPYIFKPSVSPIEGTIILSPFTRDGSLEVFVPLFQQNLTTFKEICYSLY